MENTGRISRGITPTAQRLLFGESADESINAELAYIVQVDRAHLVMLAECGLVTHRQAAALLGLIAQLEAEEFAALRGRKAARGLYLLYEDYLIQRLGGEVGGVLHTARSRNDLQATTLRLRLRRPFLGILRETLRLQATLLACSRRHAAVAMPLYTHYQAALPVTFGHYLAGVACSIERDVEALWAVTADLNRSPLGAGAGGGTALPINPQRTAGLLGFDKAVLHSIDAVATRDAVLRLLSAAAMLGVTLSRLAADLLLWTTAEFGFGRLPDHLVGSSSMMPQKRNPFLLEHVQGRSAAALGAFVSAVTAMHAKPFTNSIAVGTEATGQVWGAVRQVTEAAIFARLMIAGFAPQPEPMRRRAAQGYTAATELANRMAVSGGMAFRRAHQEVGTIIRKAIERGEQPLEQAAAEWLSNAQDPISLAGLDPAAVVQASVYGGGPGADSFSSCWRELRAAWGRQTAQKRAMEQQWRAAEKELAAAVHQMQA